MNPGVAEIDANLIGRRRRATGEPALYLAATGSALMILLMLAALLVVLFVAAVPSIRRFGGDFLVSSAWRANSLPVLKLDARGKPIRDARTGMKVVDHYDPPRFGALASISGTAATSAIALLLSVPLSLGTAMYLVRIAPNFDGDSHLVPHRVSGSHSEHRVRAVGHVRAGAMDGRTGAMGPDFWIHAVSIGNRKQADFRFPSCSGIPMDRRDSGSAGKLSPFPPPGGIFWSRGSFWGSW